jgi:hypothetical protein
LVAPLRRLQKELEMAHADGNERNGVLVREERAAFAQVTLRLPVDRLDLVLGALARAYDGIAAPGAVVKTNQPHRVEVAGWRLELLDIYLTHYRPACASPRPTICFRIARCAAGGSIGYPAASPNS